MTTLHPLPPVTADERVTLEQFLDYFRSVLLRKADGIDEVQARQRVGASAVDMLRRLQVPCAGVVMSDGTDRPRALL